MFIWNKLTTIGTFIKYKFFSFKFQAYSPLVRKPIKDSLVKFSGDKSI